MKIDEERKNFQREHEKSRYDRLIVDQKLNELCLQFQEKRRQILDSEENKMSRTKEMRCLDYCQF